MIPREVLEAVGKEARRYAKGWPCRARVTLLPLSPKGRSKSGEKFLWDASSVVTKRERLRGSHVWPQVHKIEEKVFLQKGGRWRQVE